MNIKKRAFISFDFDNDLYLRNLLAGQAKLPDSPFEFHSHKQLNTQKFKIIHQMEKQLPVELYKDEWTNLGEGKNWKKYIPFSHIEMTIPFVFIFLYGALLIISFGKC